MSTDDRFERYDPATVELVARALPFALPSASRGVARHVLNALADAGLLLPPGGETREEWGARVWADGHRDQAEDCARSNRAAAEGTVDSHARRRAANPPEDDLVSRRWMGNAVLIRRTVHVGPWTEVPDDPS